LEQRGGEHEDTLVRTVGGKGLAINGLVDPRKYDPLFLGRYGEKWVFVVKPSSGYFHPCQIMTLDRSFNLLTQYELEGKDQRIMGSKLADSQLVVCQSHYITVYSLKTDKAVGRSFDDVFGSYPDLIGQQFIDADLFGPTLYACIAEAIVTIPDVITGIEEPESETKQTAMVVTRNEVIDIQQNSTQDIQSVRLFSVQGVCRTIEVHSNGARFQLRGTDLWPGLNLVVLADRSMLILCIL